MRSTDERLVAVQARSRVLKRRRNQRRGIVVSTITTAACVAAIVGVAFVIPGALSGTSVPVMGTSGAFGSILASGGMLGYVVIGILAFCLGVAATLLCVKLRERAMDDAADENLKGDDNRGNEGAL